MDNMFGAKMGNVFISMRERNEAGSAHVKFMEEMMRPIPKPILLMPKVPSLLVVGLLAAQFLILQITHNPEPSCTLNIERSHYSTSLSEIQNVDAIN